ncbi:PQQ-binding-like beta-propeller repeat protein [Streptomyces sp. NPDC006739]|uniref:outer membrane protein assembly factor BamB family protein n=1 Tax=Streptomyces sp. NPDC006739 TaxID=3364763 RepID=UPI0036AB1951
MTQPPPPPPHQPPQQGGFGPPQGQPPQQPGYGYPPPAPAPGYGYPAQPPNPYAQPAPPPAAPYGGPPAYGQRPQPGYGYPGQPTVPMQPQPGQPGGSGRPRTTLVIVVAALVAIALIVGGGIWYAKSSGGAGKKENTASSGGGTGGGDGGGTGGPSSGAKEKAPADPAAKLLYQVPMPKVNDTVATPGSWLTDKVYAKSGVAEIVGYDPTTGGKVWTIKLSGPVCAASREVTADNLAAITFQPKMPAKGSTAGCSQIAAIDLKAGKKLWTKSVGSGDFPISFRNVTVAQHTVAVGSTNGGAAFDITSGDVLWQPKQADTCYDGGYAGGAKLVAVRTCGEFDNKQLHIQTIDPKSGKVISEYKMAQGIDYASVVSTDPLVVAADVGDSAKDGSGISDYFSIDNRTGTLRTRISAPSDTYGGHCDGLTRIDYCTEIAVGNDRLYVPTEVHNGTGPVSESNEVIAFDLATGKQTGQRADSGDGYTLSPLRMDGGNLIAYKKPPYDKGGQIVSIDGGSFKETELLENPATQSARDLESSMLPDIAEYVYARGRLFMSAVYADKPSSGSEKEDLVVAFGTGG